LRKLDTDIAETNKKLTRKINKDVNTAKKEAIALADEHTKRLENEMCHLKKQRVRDKSDFDTATQKIRDLTTTLGGKLNKHGEYFSALAGITSTLIENVNMQMEAETADLLDRRMMQLLGAAHKKNRHYSCQKDN
jgi:septal ring factor EnvC (AmiA/AmiB activator)